MVTRVNKVIAAACLCCCDSSCRGTGNPTIPGIVFLNSPAHLLGLSPAQIHGIFGCYCCHNQSIIRSMIARWIHQLLLSFLLRFVNKLNATAQLTSQPQAPTAPNLRHPTTSHHLPTSSASCSWCASRYFAVSFSADRCRGHATTARPNFSAVSNDIHNSHYIPQLVWPCS
jgi:hypothetical protein